MNKASRATRRFLAKTKGTITVPRSRTSNGSKNLTTQNYTILYGSQPRKSEHPKVARNFKLPTSDNNS